MAAAFSPPRDRFVTGSATSAERVRRARRAGWLLLRIQRIRRSGLLRQQHDMQDEAVDESNIVGVQLLLNAGHHALGVFYCLKGYRLEIWIIERRGNCILYGVTIFWC